MDRLIDRTIRLTTRREFTIGAVLAGAVFALPRSGAIASARQTADLTSADLPTLDVNVLADSLEGVPETIAAGRYLLNVTVADGVDEGIVAFVQPPSGMSASEFLAAAGIGQGPPETDASPMAEEEGGEEGGEEEGPLPTFVYQARFAGGAIAATGVTGSAVLDLTEGEWFAWGDDPASPQMPVIFTVTGEFPADAAAPESDITATLIDFGINVEGNLIAGDHIVMVDNQGAQPHFLDLSKVPDGTTNEDIGALLDVAMSGTPTPEGGLSFETDFKFVTYTPTQSIGTQTWHMISLEAGTYAAMCWFPTAGVGAPHAVMGMHSVFEVTA